GIDVLLRRDAARERIAEVRLWEGSPVTWGANPLTPTVDVKALKQGLDDLHALRKTVRGPLSDEMAQTMEARLADLESRLLALKDALLSGDVSPLAPVNDPAGDGATGLLGGPRDEAE